MSTILFIPVYNCELQIKRLIKKLKRKKLKKINEILFVDNQSVDETLKTLVNETKGFSSKITIIQNNKNYGLGGSHKVALSYAINNRYNDLIVFHGDDQGKIEDLDKIILSDKKRKYDFILGSRFMKGSILNNYNLIRILGNIFFNFIFSAITLKKLYDLGAGLNLLRLDNLDTVTQFTMILLITSNRTLQFIHGHGGYAADVNYMSIQGTHLVDMDAGDTVSLSVNLPSLGTAQMDINSNTSFSGYLVA